MPQEERWGDWIQVYTGGRFYPFDPRPGEVRVKDIAHALANTARFSGHTDHFYSVAQHSVLASLVLPDPYRLWGLLHDCAEAYLGDIARPLKRDLYFYQGEHHDGTPDLLSIEEIEENIRRVVCEAFAIPHPSREDNEAIKTVDLRLLVTEHRDLMKPVLRLDVDEHFLPYAWRIDPWSPQKSENEFLRTFDSLTRGERC